LNTLNIEHPDILEFLDVKLDRKELNNHNISINYSREFFNAVKRDEVWTFKFRGATYNRYCLRRYNTDIEEEDFIYINAINEKNAIETAKNYYRNHWLDEFEIIKSGTNPFACN